MQVSRRLTRRIKHALIAKQYGYVEIAVHAYRRLLEQSCTDETTYSYTYFAKELVQQPDTVVRACKQVHLTGMAFIRQCASSCCWTIDNV